MQVLDGLIPTLYESLDVVSRELIGVIPACELDARASQQAFNQPLASPVTGEVELEDFTPSSTAPNPTQSVVDNRQLIMNRMKRAKVTWSGDEQMSVETLATPIMKQQYEQAMRAVANAIEADCAEEAVAGALAFGNVVGTPGTSPFASDTKALTRARKILADNGAIGSNGEIPQLECILNTEAAMDLRNLDKLQKVNESGDDTLLRRGLLGNLYGFGIRESAGFKPHTKGVAEGYLVNGDIAKGVTEITIDTGSGAFNKGDIVTFGSDTTHMYIVAEDLDSGGTLLKITTPLTVEVADNAAVNVSESYLSSAAFRRGAVQLATRVPAVPTFNGVVRDLAIDRTIITDPVSKISFEVAIWGGAYQATITFAAVWGVRNIKGEHSVALLG